MDQETIEELKQFILTAIAQQTSDLRGDISEMKGDISEMKGDISEMKGDIREIKGDIKRLDKKIDDLSEHVATALDTSNEETEKQLKDHELRITNLETKAA